MKKFLTKIAAKIITKDNAKIMLIVTAAAVLIVITAKYDVADETKYTPYTASQSSSAGDSSGDSNAESGEDSSEISEDSEPTYNFPADINLVTFDQLCAIDGIGEKTAEDILEYREKVGMITDIEQLAEIDGIGEKTVEMLKNYLYVDERDRKPYEPNESESDDETDSADAQPQTELPEPEPPAPEPEPEPTEELPEYTRVNINLATAEEISRCLLLPIETADEIVAVRELIVEYSDIYELLLVESLSQEQIAEFAEFVEM